MWALRSCCLRSSFSISATQGLPFGGARRVGQVRLVGGSRRGGDRVHASRCCHDRPRTTPTRLRACPSEQVVDLLGGEPGEVVGPRRVGSARRRCRRGRTATFFHATSAATSTSWGPRRAPGRPGHVGGDDVPRAAGRRSPAARPRRPAAAISAAYSRPPRRPRATRPAASVTACARSGRRAALGEQRASRWRSAGRRRGSLTVGRRLRAASRRAAFLRPRGARGRPPVAVSTQLVERLAQALAEQVGVGQQVAVGGDAVEDARRRTT